jgi:hypothetical protein
MTADGKDKTTENATDPPGATPPGEPATGDGKTVSGATGDATPPTTTDNDVESDEVGGRKKGLDPTRYGDWEKNGRAIDF